jgi:hypothetical protein
MARSDWTYSRSRGAGAVQGTENRRSLCGRICGPIPSTKRPREAICRSHDVLATTIGLRGKAMTTEVPSCIRSVQTAAIACARNGSFLFSIVSAPS